MADSNGNQKQEALFTQWNFWAAILSKAALSKVKDTFLPYLRRRSAQPRAGSPAPQAANIHKVPKARGMVTKLANKYTNLQGYRTNLKVSACGGQDEDVVAVYELREDADRVPEASLVLDVFGSQVVPEIRLRH